MSLFNEILAMSDANWSYNSYNDKVCVQQCLAKGTDEWDQIEDKIFDKFGTVDIHQILRVQHPFAFGRFMIRKHQLKSRTGKMPKSKRKYLVVCDYSDVRNILKTNDMERVVDLYDCEFRNYVEPSDEAIIVIKRLCTSTQRDTNSYPEYVVKLHHDDSVNSLIDAFEGWQL